MDHVFPPGGLNALVRCSGLFLPFLAHLLDRALLFYLFALLSFTMRLPDFTLDGEHHMPPPLAIILRVTITLSTIADAVCLLRIWVTLRRYNSVYSTLEVHGRRFGIV
jgi:hypothetical protein